MRSDLLQQPGAIALRPPAGNRRTASLSSRYRRRIQRSSAGNVRFLHGRLFRGYSSVQSVRGYMNPETEFPEDGTAAAVQQSMMENGFLANCETNSPVEICATRTLPPALTMSEAVEKLSEEVAKMKSNLHSLASGVLRLQIAVPPSIKPENWLLSQNWSSKIFPQFYISANKEADEAIAAIPDGMIGVSGIGAAVYIKGSSPTLDVEKLTRYLSVDSPLITAYGFMGIHRDKKSSTAELVSQSFYAVIPQFEMDEFEDCSILALTLAWDSSLLFSFNKTICSAEQMLFHVVSSNPVIGKVCHESWYLPVGGLSSIVGLKQFNMVHINGKHLERMTVESYSDQMEQLQTTCHAYFRLSDSVTLATNKFKGLCETNVSVSESANINAVWASLIVEELVRLGLTYFCIAPGSRSSPLALSASAHRLTTCISCFDERSLAFHAVGYARGSSRPAVVITSSGTAVSNLLPAVVEASQDFLPMLLLTADRPPELHDCGANQAINQVNHFGEFVRHSFNLPPPTDELPARMVLTTIDSAIYIATHPVGSPVHINCPFREPLDNYPMEWTRNCLKGLDSWMSNQTPFTKYYDIQKFSSCGQINDVLEVVKHAERGILIVGGLHSEDEIWAALLLAKQLLWPVVTDILSGLRIRKSWGVFSAEDDLLFVDHLDHVLVSDLAKICMEPDVVLQIGSRLTSKRISQFLEFHSPRSYILVDKHPYRHDHSHIVTHRVQSTVVEFAHSLRKNHFPPKMRKWRRFLQMLSTTVAREISFQLSAECSLTEPYVGHVIAESLRDNSALFVGNSMVIRDADMYGRGWVESRSSALNQLCHALPLQGIRVAGNRGASGIDGLLSTAVGFSVGCNKRVLCVIGDISFLHDTNGLAILNQRIQRKPMTILVINNHGGAIFSLLPIAERTDANILNKYFYTSHDISVRKLCEAHSLQHLHVQTKMELMLALSKCKHSQRDYVIEVESSIENNSTFHRMLRWSAGRVTDQAIQILSPVKESRLMNPASLLKIVKLEYSLYRIQLALPLTSPPKNNDGNSLYKEGYVLSLTLDDGSVGFGEAAPISIHKEDLDDVEEQLKFLVHVLEGAEINSLLSTLRGSFSSWFWTYLGIEPSTIYPSVRCGIEAAILHALAKQRGSSLSDELFGYVEPSLTLKTDEVGTKGPGIQVCGLVDSNGTPDEVSHLVSQMVAEGFTTIKLKVARRRDPLEDADVVKKIREEIGYEINLRVDANRGWSYEQAVLFGSSVKHCSLQYIEEPVQLEEDILRFCEETNLPVALDETIDNIEGDHLNKLEKFVHPGIVALVIKPSVVGGFENSALIARWAQQHDKMFIISSAFESSLSLATYVIFSYYLERDAVEKSIVMGKEIRSKAAHGLGTYRWLKEDLSTETINMMEASVEDACKFLQRFNVDQKTVLRSYSGEQVKPYTWTHDDVDFSCSIKVKEVGTANDQVALFLHGFLGDGNDWIPMMKALSASTRCISVDLPGHGESEINWKKVNVEERERSMSVELVGDLLHQLLFHLTKKKVILVGYSLGARISLYMATKYRNKIGGMVMISGSPGMRDDALRRARIEQDDARANYLSSHGLECFLQTWYTGDLWNSFRNHPHYRRIVSNRRRNGDPEALAEALSGLSVGRQRPLWEELVNLSEPILLVYGQKDAKFKGIAQKMLNEILTPNGDHEDDGDDDDETSARIGSLCTLLEIPNSGHAVHLENPLPLVNAVRKFIARLKKT